MANFIDQELKTIMDAYATEIKAKMPDSVAKLIEVEIRDNGAGVLAPFWLPVLERGRAPRKSTKDHKLYYKIYLWMAKRNMFKSRTTEGKRNEAKALTWFINKYGTKLFRDKGFKEVYSKATEKVVVTATIAIGNRAFEITREIF